MSAPTLVFAWGNPARGDDALGPLFLEGLQARCCQHPEWGQVDFLTDYQLAIEHALDLRGRRRVLFADAHCRLAAPCTLARIHPGRDGSFTSHSLTPQALLQVYVEIERGEPPPCWLLSMHADAMDLGATLSPLASQCLEKGLEAAMQWLAQPMSDPMS